MGCVPCTLGFGSCFVGISAPLAADCVLLSVDPGENLATRVCASRGEGVRHAQLFRLKKDLLVMVVNPL